MGIVVGLIILSVMMIVHELGHYLTGRRLGFAIEEFAIFMGPVLFSWEKKGIKYSIKLLPIGASVRFAGEYLDNDEVDMDPSHFYNRPKWARAIVISTGPALNLLSGVLAFFIMFASFGYTIPVIGQIQKGTQAAAAGLQTGDRILRADGEAIRTTLDYSGQEMFFSDDQTVDLLVRGSDGQTRTAVLQPAVSDVYRLGIQIRVDNSLGTVIESVDADSNGGNPVLKANDILKAANGVPADDLNAFSAAVQASAGKTVEVTIQRDGQEMTVVTQPALTQVVNDRGITFQSQTAILPAIGQSFQWSWSIIKVTVRSIGLMFAGTVKPQDTLSGPVGVVSLISDVVTQEEPLVDKIYQLLWMFALISVSLGFMNLLPIPPLDGNHLVLIGVEAIRRKRLSVKIQNLIGLVGIGIIVILALAGLYFDIMRLTGK
ncbi:MAG: RIP metalloprotease RseP [Clostridiaceae bacterium]|nr:RIP metalloprotease RseP [Clostridiaceae bacterium]